jgi:hypothetical protein
MMQATSSSALGSNFQMLKVATGDYNSEDAQMDGFSYASGEHEDVCILARCLSRGDFLCYAIASSATSG